MNRKFAKGMLQLNEAKKLMARWNRLDECGSQPGIDECNLEDDENCCDIPDNPNDYDDYDDDVEKLFEGNTNKNRFQDYNDIDDDDEYNYNQKEPMKKSHKVRIMKDNNKTYGRNKHRKDESITNRIINEASSRVVYNFLRGKRY